MASTQESLRLPRASRLVRFSLSISTVGSKASLHVPNIPPSRLAYLFCVPDNEDELPLPVSTMRRVVDDDQSTRAYSY